MVEIAVAGNEEFLLGFKLAGVRHTFNTEEDAKGTLEDAMDMENVGVLVVDEKTMSALPERFRDDISNSVNPVVVQLSKDSESSQLRQKIVRAIGVDLWDR